MSKIRIDAKVADDFTFSEADGMEIKAVFSTLEMLLFRLLVLATTPKVAAHRDKLEADALYLREHLLALEFSEHGTPGRWMLDAKPGPGASRAELERILSSGPVKAVISQMGKEAREARTVAQADPRVYMKEGPPPPEPVRIPGHLANQFLKAKTDPAVRRQYELFIEAHQAEPDKVLNFPAELTAAERLMVTAFSILLQHNSANTTDSGADGYYQGNTGEKLVPYALGFQAPAPTLYVSWYEIAKIFYGKTKVSGTHIRQARAVVRQLAEKKHVAHIYSRRNSIGDKQEFHEIEVTRPLLLIREERKVTKHRADGTKESAGFVEVELSPIFQDQIGTYWVDVPADYLARVWAANNSRQGQRIAESTVCLLHYLAAQLMYGNDDATPGGLKKVQIGVTKLREKMQLGGSTYRSNPARVLEKIALAVDIAQEVGLIAKYTTEPGRAGELIYNFVLDRAWKYPRRTPPLQA